MQNFKNFQQKLMSDSSFDHACILKKRIRSNHILQRGFLGLEKTVLKENRVIGGVY